MQRTLRLALISLISVIVLFIVLTGITGIERVSAAPGKALVAPTLASPADGESFAFDAQPFIFKWSAVNKATEYRLQISTTSSFSTFIYNVTPSSTGWAAQTPLNAGTYYWRVRAIASNGSEGTWSQTRRVVVMQPVFPAPGIQGPADGERFAFDMQSFVFNWDPVEGAEGYAFQVASDAGFTKLLYDVLPFSDGWAAKTPFAAGTYYWRVKARAAGRDGLWTATRSVVITPAPLPAPVVLSPAANAQIAFEAQPIVLSWESLIGATSYSVQIAATSDFAAPIADTSTAGTNWTAPALNSGAYFWRVRTLNGATAGDWSAAASFVILPQMLPAPTLVAPINDAQIAFELQPFILDWDGVAEATGYQLQVAGSADFAVLIADSVTTADHWSAQGLATGTYFWRVRTLNGVTAGNWSATASFAVQSQLLGAPAIVAPSDSEEIPYEAQPFVFNWDPVAGATNYHIQIATTADFSSMLYDVMPSSHGWAAKTPFNAGTYYWRISAMESGVQGNWSAVLKVVITAPAPTPIAPQYRPMATQIPYTATSPWNTPIGANPVYDRYSSQMIADMGKGVTGGKIYSDTTQYTYPVYFADKNTPRYSVPCTQYKCTVVDANGTVTRVTSITLPIPNGAKQSAGTDAQLIVIDTDTGTEYGLYHAAKQADGSWTAGNGYIYSINYAGTQPGFGSRGAGVPYYAGLIRPWEIRQGEINHAIAFVYQFTAATKCVFPAAQTDGTTTSGYPIPEGARIQLNPNLTEADFDRWGLTRAGKIVARAMQKYGMILIDTGGSPKIIAENLSANTLYGESWADADLNYTKNVIANIPYNELRVLRLPDGYYYGATANYGKCIK